MSRVCSVCGKGRMSGNAVSHSNRKTRRSWAPNDQKVKVSTPTGGVKDVYVCTRCLRMSHSLTVSLGALSDIVYRPLIQVLKTHFQFLKPLERNHPVPDE